MREHENFQQFFIRCDFVEIKHKSVFPRFQHIAASCISFAAEPRAKAKPKTKNGSKARERSKTHIYGIQLFMFVYLFAFLCGKYFFLFTIAVVVDSHTLCLALCCSLEKYKSMKKRLPRRRRAQKML